MKATIVSTKSGDWEALYIDGKLAEQGHSVPLYAALRATGIEVDTGEFAEDEDGDVDVAWNLEDVEMAPVEGL